MRPERIVSYASNELTGKEGKEKEEGRTFVVPKENAIEGSKKKTRAGKEKCTSPGPALQDGI